MNLNSLTAAVATLILVSCGAGPGGPEPIPLDRVDCARCGMLISSDTNAAQSQTPGRPARFFDDVGCLATDADATAAEAHRYVRVPSGEWVAAEAAWFARPAAARTPMDYGIVAFPTEAEARSADRNSQPLRWPAAVAAAKTR